MSVETERSSTESCGASGLDFEDTALTLTLRLPGDADRKRSASDAGQSSSLPAAAGGGAPPAPKCVPYLSLPLRDSVARNYARVAWIDRGVLLSVWLVREQVVGWPPVRESRRKALEDVAARSTRAAPAKFVKVAVDGEPILRKVNLQDYSGYDQLLRALQDKFCSHFTIRRFGNDETKLVDAVNGTEYVPTYEDKDGDWMLVGDVPWKMFVEACRRLRLMKNSEAVNLAPRAAR
ncbi:unnamed protein product [Alopecurus aequalis]